MPLRTGSWMLMCTVMNASDSVSEQRDRRDPLRDIVSTTRCQVIGSVTANAPGYAPAACMNLRARRQGNGWQSDWGKHYTRDRTRRRWRECSRAETAEYTEQVGGWHGRTRDGRRGRDTTAAGADET